MKPLTLPDRLICGYFDCSTFAGLSASPERVRTLYEIEYYLENGLSTFSDGNEYPIRRAHVLIGLPAQRCNSLLPFKTKYLKCNASDELASFLASLPPYFPVCSAHRVETLFDALIAAQEEKDTIRLAASFFSLLAALSEEAVTATRATAPAELAVAQAKQYVEEHYRDTIKLSDIASSASLSPSYFHTLFSTSVGKTPHEYLLERRIKAATELLSLTSLSMSEIAERSGFANQQYLGTVFKAHTGLSPVQYRKLHRRDYLV